MIDILLSTYNAGDFLKSQIDSILNQTHKNFTIKARDDGSSDNTKAVLTEYQEILLLNDNLGNLGAMKSFNVLMSNSQSDYIAFCDQDDIWNSNKLEIMLKKLQEMEAIYGIQTPILVHCDLTVVDSNIKEISKSFWKYQKIDPYRDSPRFLMLQNVVTGCTILANQSLIKLSSPLPESAIMHDWWLALVASCFGKIGIIEKPLVLYRQHPKNTIGASFFSYNFMIKTLVKQIQSNYVSDRLYKTQIQAREFYDRYRVLLSEVDRELILAYSEFPNISFLEKRRRLIKYGFQKCGIFRNLGLWISV